jgi:hypothetical protein
MSWLQELLRQHEELESPPAFWYWAGLCSISAVVKDNVYLERGGAFNTYPNIYVLLHAGSGLKKGPPVALARRLVTRVNNTRIISGRASIQGILKELSQAQTKPGGVIEKNSSCFYVASEFSSSLVADPAAMTILTDLYDRNYNSGEYRSLLKMETFKLTNPCISLLVATNEAHFEDFIPNKDVHGGFVGRIFVVAERKVQKRNPLIRKLSVQPDEEKLAQYLRTLVNLKGAFQSIEDTSAGNLYEEWYHEFYGEIDTSDDKDETGTAERVGDAVLKVAMLLSLSDSPSLIISDDNMREAIGVCEKLLGNVRRTVGKTGMSSTVHQKTLIITELLKADSNAITRKAFMSKNWMHYDDGEQLADCTNALEEAGIIQVQSQGNQIIYVMPPDQVKQWKHFLKEDQ